MVRRGLIVLLALFPLTMTAQEVLTPLQRVVVPQRRTIKMQPAVLQLPFFDDFATGTLSAARWQQQGGATATFDVRPLAPTVGVLTFDALGDDGCLYLHASTNIFSADTVTSLPIALDNLTPADSVVLSFYYLPGGGIGQQWELVGMEPDPRDSLFLDFYRAADSSWFNVWAAGGESVADMRARTGRDWQYVAVAVTDIGCFDSTFHFRFRNHASLEITTKSGLAGNCDYWHVDYVVLDSGRTVRIEPDVRDIAFAAPAGSFLHSYRAMPYSQYSADEMAANADMTITNRYSSMLASHYGYSVLDADGNEVYSYDGGYENVPPFMPGENYQTASAHAHPAINYSFPVMTTPTEYTIVHVVREGAGGDLYCDNDTVRFLQRFGEYYAYDDGSSENGYSLESTSSTMYLAYRFDLNSADTLTAVDLFFNSTQDAENETVPFYLTVWSMGADSCPSEVIYRDPTRRYPLAGSYHRYVLDESVVVNGSIFVGFEQRNNVFINLGFDRSLNTADRIFYRTDTAWRKSFLSGSLMLRPCFGAAAAVGISDLQLPTSALNIYPNPASDRVFVDGEVERIELYDMQGRRLMATYGNELGVSHIPNGFYLLRLYSNTGTIYHSSLIIHH